MILVPLTQASLRLGIDLKTLRCWLAQAQLPVHTDPQDAAKKASMWNTCTCLPPSTSAP